MLTPYHFIAGLDRALRMVSGVANPARISPGLHAAETPLLPARAATRQWPG